MISSPHPDLSPPGEEAEASACIGGFMFWLRVYVISVLEVVFALKLTHS